MKRLVALLLLGCLAAADGRAQADPELPRQAKALFFDRKYSESRAAWERLARAGEEGAGYWVARCSEKLGEDERALGEYAAYLARDPKDPTLVEEARTARIGIAARLYRAGRKSYLSLLEEGLDARDRTVRYYAALQLAGLGSEAGRAALPVLHSIVEKETDPDLVDRARLALLRVDPKALARAPEPGKSPLRSVRLRIYKAGSKEPELSINMPLALADLLFRSLPDDVKRDLKDEGWDVDTFFDRLRNLSPMEIVEIQGDDGERIRLWIE